MRTTRRRFIETGSALGLVATTGCTKFTEAVLDGLIPPKRNIGACLAPQSTHLDPVSHVLNRLAFGPKPDDYARVCALGSSLEEAARAFIEEQLNPGGIDDAVAEYAVRQFETLKLPLGELFEYQDNLLLEELTRATLLRAVESKRQLFETMVQFWTDHFNIDPSKGDCKWLKVADDREVIRKHALGRFPDMVRASALSPAMLWYLDGRVNTKSSPEERPNENYARELLELHTLGVHGGYSQQDVMEVARCLSGWTVRSEQVFFKGRVEFHPDRHDDGEKVILGQVIPAGLGEKDLDRLLEIVCLHPATANYLANRLCRRFIDDDPSEATVQAVAESFLASAGDIPATLRTLFGSEAFWSSRGNRFKRPFEFIVSALRTTGAETDAGRPIYDYLLRMGHAPFQYPTPDGYPLEPSPWMGTLLWRWNFAVALAENRIPGTQVKAEDWIKRFPSREDYIAHFLGREPMVEELEAFHATDTGLAVILGSPTFQRC